VTTPIVARWEWRTFAGRFDADVDRRFDALPTERVDESDETYLVSPHSDASVKVRAGLVDVKTVVHRSDDGLERWQPVLKAPYPLSGLDVGVLVRALCVTLPPLTRNAYARDELVDELIGPHPELLPVRVHKHRAHFTLDGCMAERSEVRSGHGVQRTIAIESEDGDLVRATVRELGFDVGTNVSLPRELKLLAGVA
jgi:exopolyphosphatase / guanosine-5'-triphosphate,3'-diphosphate pyrophosphatase